MIFSRRSRDTFKSRGSGFGNRGGKTENIRFWRQVPAPGAQAERFDFMMRKLSHEEIVARQTVKQTQPHLPVTVVLNNIRSLYNVGSVFRTADGAGVEKIWLCGITGAPPQDQIYKTALGAEERVPWEYARDVFSVINGLRQQGYQIVLLEQTNQSCPYEEFVPQFPLCLVLGNEVEGVSEGLVPLCDQAVDIEMRGIKNSLNVGVAFGIVIYYLRMCHKRIGWTAGLAP